jgi:hypothetical protein
MKQYFYKDEFGKTQKLVYCSRCNSKPYRQEQIGTDIIKVTNFVYICQDCANFLHLLSFQKKAILDEEPDVEQILKDKEITKLITQAEHLKK